MHTAGIAKATLAKAGIELVPPFPPCPPDLNPNEGVWALLKRRINGCRPRPTTYEDIKEALIEEWDPLSPEDYEVMIISMPERVQAVLANEGGTHTGRWRRSIELLWKPRCTLRLKEDT